MLDLVVAEFQNIIDRNTSVLAWAIGALITRVIIGLILENL